MANYHVSKHPDGWEVSRAGSERASKVCKTQKDAISTGRDLVNNSGGGELRIHGEDGKIRNSNTYGKSDPNPPKDKKH